MNMLIEELQGLAADPRSWAIVALMALVAGISVIRLWQCPHIAGTYQATDEEVSRAGKKGFKTLAPVDFTHRVVTKGFIRLFTSIFGNRARSVGLKSLKMSLNSEKVMNHMDD